MFPRTPVKGNVRGVLGSHGRSENVSRARPVVDERNGRPTLERTHTAWGRQSDALGSGLCEGRSGPRLGIRGPR